MRGPRPLPHTSGQGTARKMGPRSKRGCVGRGGSSPRARRPPLHSRTPSSALQAVASAPTQAGEPPPAFWTQLTRPDFPRPSRGSVRLPVPVTTGAAGTPRGWGSVRAGRRTPGQVHLCLPVEGPVPQRRVSGLVPARLRLSHLALAQHWTAVNARPLVCQRGQWHSSSPCRLRPPRALAPWSTAGLGPQPRALADGRG